MAATTPLETLGEPLFHRVDGTDLAAPTPRLAEAQRTRVRHLSGMQKEALVTSSRTGRTWRLASDEGDYLDGDDVAPNPLAFMAAGMAASYADAILDLADRRVVEVADLGLVVDTYYTMSGSALRGDLAGGALPPDVAVTVEADADAATVRALVEDAVAAAPFTGLLAGEHVSAFRLALDGEAVPTGRVGEFDGPLLAEEAAAFDDVPRGGAETDPPAFRHTGRTAEAFDGDRSKYTAGESSSLADEQDRVLHIRGALTLLDGGLRHVEVTNYSPQASVFELVAAGPDADPGLAPDALTYVVAGIGFCFMTQFGRYADITDRALPDYRIVQDTHFAAGDGDSPPRADPVRTRVFLETPEGDVFAREVLDMAEQTCFIHALCRTDLAPDVDVATA